MNVIVEVFLKPGVLDVQGKAVEHALHDLGFGGVANVRIGKRFSFEAPPEVSEADVRTICEQVLANGVIETYTIKMGP